MTSNASFAAFCATFCVLMAAGVDEGVAACTNEETGSINVCVATHAGALMVIGDGQNSETCDKETLKPHCSVEQDMVTCIEGLSLDRNGTCFLAVPSKIDEMLRMANINCTVEDFFMACPDNDNPWRNAANDGNDSDITTAASSFLILTSLMTSSLALLARRY